MVKKIILLGLLATGLYANEMETVDVKVCIDTTKHADKSFNQMKEMLVSIAQDEGYNSLYKRALGKENKNALTDHHRKDLVVKVNEQLDEGNNFCNSSTVSIKKDRLQYYLPQKVSKDRICHKDGNLSPAKLKEAAALKGYKALIAEITDKEISDELAKTLVHNYQRDDGKMYMAQGAYCFGASGEVVPFEIETGKDTSNSSLQASAMDHTIYGKWHGSYFWKGDSKRFLLLNIEIKKDNTFKATWNRGDQVQNAYFTGTVMKNSRKVLLLADKNSLKGAPSGWTTDPFELMFDEDALTLNGKIHEYSRKSGVSLIKVDKFPLEYTIKNPEDDINGKWYGWYQCGSGNYFYLRMVIKDEKAKIVFDNGKAVKYTTKPYIHSILKKSKRKLYIDGNKAMQTYVSIGKVRKDWDNDNFNVIVDGNIMEGTSTCSDYNNKFFATKVSKFVTGF